MFCFPRTSKSTLKNLLTYNNVGCVVSVDEGSLTISEDSRFYGNTGVVGAVIVASRSNVSLTGTQFLENSYLNPGGCLALRDGSSAFIHSVFFGLNVGNRATAISATSLRRLDISDSHFGQECKECGGFIFVNHSVDATSAITISNSHLGSFKQFDTTGKRNPPRGLLVIDHFDNGHVLLESVDFGRQLESTCVLGDRGDRVGMVVLMDTHNVSFTSSKSSYTRADGALGTGLRFVDSSGRFRIEQALFHRINCCDVGYGIFLRITPCDHMRSTLSVIDSEFSSNHFYGGTIFVTGSDADVEVSGSRFIDNEARNSRFFSIPVTSILSVSNINALHVSNCTAQNNIALTDSQSAPVLGSLHIDRTKHVKIEGSTFIANSAKTRRGDSGGAIYFSSGGKDSKLEVIDCEFEDNIAAAGGAIYANGLSDFDMTGCSFRNNNAVASGGAVLAVVENEIHLTDSVFVNNQARIGGAMALGSKERFLVAECAFFENKAQLYGGAIALMHIPTEEIRWTIGFPFSLRMSSVAFLKNTATFGGETCRA